MKTTIVIPNYNGIAYMDQCLKSLEAERETKFETIVVDNGSTDGSWELVEQKYPWVRLIAFPRNLGFCKAVNEGILATETPYVILLNNDTEVLPGFVRALEDAMDQKPDYFSLNSRMLCLSHKDRMDDAGDLYCALGWAFSPAKDRPASEYDREQDVFAVCGGASIYRREVFDQIGLFDENHFAYLEDVDIGYRAKIHGYRNGYCPKASVYHAGSASSGSRYNAFKISHSSRNSIYLIYKNMPLLQVLVNLPFLVPGFLVKQLFFCKKGFGKLYAKGLLQGFRLSFSKEGRKHKIKFQWKYLRNYCKIQLELWKNMAKRFCN